MFEIVNGGAENDIVETDPSNKELAIGLRVPTSVKIPSTYLDGLRKYKDIYQDIYKQMEVANKLYRYNGIIGNAVDILVDFAVTKVVPLETGDKKLDEILNYFFENLNENNTNTMQGVYPLMQELALEWFTSGNAFPYNKWEDVEIGKTFYKIPMSINLINPQSIEIPDDPIAFGQEVIYLKYDSELVNKLRSDGRKSPEAALIKQAIPRSVINAIVNDNAFSHGIRLNPKYITHLKRRAKGYQAWGVPYLTRCFSSTSLLERLRELDESITSGLLNLVTIFKIGTEEHPASPDRLRKFAALLSNPKATHTLVWAHDVEVLQSGPDGKVLQYKDKYRDAKEDILISLGIPPTLMSLNQQGNEWVSILSLVERLTHWRKIISLWIERVCNDIALYNGFKEKVKVKWDRMNLTDEGSIKNLILSFYDRGLISIKTALNDGGYLFDVEKTNKEGEKDYLEDFAPPQLPFSGDKQEIEKKRPDDSEVKPVKKTNPTETKTTVNLEEQNKKSKSGDVK